jgi:CheY-like chemotaxis protein/signal transduction histidine kinase/HPt (histidine-containing phosphotransfer) domain-containing protein
MQLSEPLGADRLKIALVWLAFAVMAALCCWAASAASGGDVRRLLDYRFGEAEDSIRMNLRLPRAAFNNIYDNLESILSSGASVADIEAAMESANAMLKETAPGGAGVFGVYGIVSGQFIDPSGVFHEAPESLGGKGWYQAALRGDQLDYSGPYKDYRTGELVLSLARVVNTNQGEYRGMLCLNAGLGWLVSYVHSLAAVEGGYGIVVNQDGTILAHPDQSLVGKSISFLEPGIRIALERADIGGARRQGPVDDTSGGRVHVWARRLFNGWRVLSAEPAGGWGGAAGQAAAAAVPAAAAFATLLSIVVLRLARARREAEKENESKTTFLTRISHEIRTPMNAIVGMSDLLLRSEKEMSAQCRAWALNIKHAGDLLLSIINDILDFSTIRSGQFKFVPLSYTLSSLVNDSINIVMVRLQEKSLVFLVFVDGSLPNNLRGDVTRVRQIILNILSNAVKYTREGYVYMMVNGHVRPGTGVLELRVSIKDTGIGIKPEDRDKLFADFSRVDPHQNRNVEGTGLGLTITKSLCQMMHGTIEFESTYGLGSTFTVMVPQEIEKAGSVAAVADPGSRKVLASLNRDDYAKSITATLENLGVRFTLCRTADELARELDGGPRDYTHALVQNAVFAKEQARIERSLPGVRVGVITEGAPGRPPRGFVYLQSPVYSLAVADFLNNTPSRRGRLPGRERRERILIPKGRILVVDDLETNLQVASALLSEYGCRIDTSASAAESLELVKRHRYDIVFMDHMMPGMDGVEATRIIRAMENGRLRDLPIVALTANAVSGMKDMFLSHGFNDFISKPIDLNVLEDAVRRWIPADKIIFVTEEELARQAADAAAREAREAELQASAALPPPLPPPQEGRAVPLPTEGLPDGFTIPDARILLVDDLPTNLEVARALLAEYRCQVDTARGGTESVEMVRSTDYDMVFMDHMMPGMDGMEAVRVIRSLEGPKYLALPIVALTANIVPGVREAFLSSGFDDFISKPIDVGLLERVLARWIPRSKMAFPEGAAPPPPPPEPAPDGGEDPGEPPPALDLVDFSEGERKSRGERGYRRILDVFRKEGETWAAVLRRDLPPPPPRELLGVFKDMECSAAVVCADGLARLASALQQAARDDDLAALDSGRYRCLAVLRNVLDRVDAYLAGGERGDAPTPPDAPAAPAQEPDAAPAAGRGAVSPGAPPAPGREPASQPAPPAAPATQPAPPAAPASQPPAPRPAPELPPGMEGLDEVDFGAGLERCRSSEDRFKRLLGFYLTDLEGWLDMIGKAGETGAIDLKDATIRFHAMKSASATVGAIRLSQEAAGMEDAGRREDAPYIEGRMERCRLILEGVRYRIERYIGGGEG